MSAASFVFGAALAGLWLYPSSSRMGMASALGLILFLVWIRRMQSRWKERMLLLLMGILMIVAPGASHPAAETALKVAASLAVLFGMGRIGILFLFPALMIAWIGGSADLFLIVSIAVGLWRPGTSARAGWLFAIALATIVAQTAVWALMRNDSLSHWDESSISRWKAARVLNSSDHRVLSREALGLLIGRIDGSRERVPDLLAAIEENVGRTDATWGMLILSDLHGNRASRARAYLAESAMRRTAVLDSLVSWDVPLPYWLPWCLFLYDAGAYPEGLKAWMCDYSALDGIAGDYLGRALAEVGLQAEACTLASDKRWRDIEWSRYLAWETHGAAEPHLPVVVVNRGSVALPPGGRYVLAKGQPARGVWPVVSYRSSGNISNVSVESELWSLMDLGTSEACTVSLMNDLRSPFEDRNLVLGERVDWDGTGLDTPAPDPGEFLMRIWKRIRTWEAPAPEGLSFARPDSTLAIRPAEWYETRPDTAGWLIAGRGWIIWREVVPGSYTLALRGEPAVGLWPVAEVLVNGDSFRLLVDDWDWEDYPIVSQAESSEVMVRFVNDYWDPLSDEDRNLWCAGLFPSSEGNLGRRQ